MEAAVHVTRTTFQDEDTEVVLLVDATTPINFFNQQATWHNIRYPLVPIYYSDHHLSTGMPQTSVVDFREEHFAV